MYPVPRFGKPSLFLEFKGILNQKKKPRFFVNDNYQPQAQASTLRNTDSDLPKEYYQIAEDWLQDNIESEVTEQYLLRTYNLSKTQLTIILSRGSE